MSERNIILSVICTHLWSTIAFTSNPTQHRREVIWVTNHTVDASLVRMCVKELCEKVYAWRWDTWRESIVKITWDKYWSVEKEFSTLYTRWTSFIDLSVKLGYISSRFTNVLEMLIFFILMLVLKKHLSSVICNPSSVNYQTHAQHCSFAISDALKTLLGICLFRYL